jgi:hypothetical protein
VLNISTESNAGVVICKTNAVPRYMEMKRVLAREAGAILCSQIPQIADPIPVQEDELSWVAVSV